MSLGIWWIRRDLRLSDNPALDAAINASSQVLPLFVLDPKLVNSSSSSKKRKDFLFAGLQQLDADLRDKGSCLTIREGDPLVVLSQILTQTGAEKIFAEEDFSHFAQSRDQKIKSHLPLKLVGRPSLRHPMDVLKNDGKPYTVFSPYMRVWKNMSLSSFGNLLPAPKRINTPPCINDWQIPISSAYEPSSSLRPGEVEAHNQLEKYVDGDIPLIFNYHNLRDRVDKGGTSRLSPYLRFGMISARQAINAALNASYRAENKDEQRGVEVWINEMIWRDFYISILYHFPYVLKRSFRFELQNVPWINHEDDFLAWCSGCTGYPIVDAGMRQLSKTGWMHNRARMITASFLVKDLLIDWRWGERWFMQNLIDGDPAANNGGWQWVAGTGTDAAPYFRIFNPILQSHKFDPAGKYARKWIPELIKVPNRYIHEPWKMPFEVQKQANCLIGNDYPQPIVNHSWARERAIDVYRSTKLDSQVEF
jgi:deoxyribodipyrimidine photo-lyase